MVPANERGPVELVAAKALRQRRRLDRGQRFPCRWSNRMSDAGRGENSEDGSLKCMCGTRTVPGGEAMLASNTGTTGVRLTETENTASSAQTMQSRIRTVLRSEIGRSRKNKIARISSASIRKSMGLSLDTA